MTSAVGRLNELAVKFRIPFPVYTFDQLQISPKSVFESTCTLTINGVQYLSTGRASQQKDAKQEAALSMFTQQLKVPANDVNRAFKMIENNNEVPVASTSAAANSLALVIEDLPDNDKNNYIGELNEYCQINRFETPIYNDLPPHGPPHCPVQSVSCKVAGIEKIHSHKTKQLAKQLAAQNVLKELKLAKPEDLIVDETDDNDDDMKDIIKLVESRGCKKIAKNYYDHVNRDRGPQTDYFAKLLREAVGKRSTELVAFAKRLQNTFNGENPYPFEEYKQWLRAHDKGVEGFFKLLMRDAGFTYTCNNPVMNSLVFVISVSLPEALENELAEDEDNDDPGNIVGIQKIENGVDAKEDCMIQIICSLGTKTAFTAFLKFRNALRQFN